jgi:hypothetical protein
MLTDFNLINADFNLINADLCWQALTGNFSALFPPYLYHVLSCCTGCYPGIL